MLFKRRISIALSIFALLATSQAMGAPGEVDAAPIQNSEKILVGDPVLGPDGLERRTFRGTMGGEASSLSNVTTGIAPFADIKGLQSPSALASCTSWWVTGKHRWKVKWYGKVNYWAEASTFYGSSTNPDACGRPALIVDKLKVSGNLKQYVFGNTFGHISKTGYNTSRVRKDASSWIGPCGGRFKHEATKSGVTWSVTTRDGCYN